MANHLKPFGLFLLHQLNPKRFIRKTFFWILIVLGIIMYSIFGTELSKAMKMTIYGLGLITVAIILLIDLYRSGEHIRWQREKYHIPSRAEIRRLKNKQEILEAEKRILDDLKRLREEEVKSSVAESEHSPTNLE
jgi:hypothetical protein